jgi:hypothetical protein
VNDHVQLTQKDIAEIVAVSIVFDLIQAALIFVPIIGWILNLIIDGIAWLTFYIMFHRRGVKFNTFERFMFFSSGIILDLIPFINTFAWTIDVLLVIKTVKLEERHHSIPQS